MSTLFTRTAVAAALAGAGTASLAMDLVDSYSKALMVDPTIAAAEQALLAGREKAVQGSALLKPKVGLSAGMTYLHDRSSTSLPAPLTQLVKPESSGNVQQAALQLSQPIYDAKALADKEQLYQQSELAIVKYRDAQQDLIQRVSEAYLNVLLAEESLRVTRAEKTAVAMQRERSQARFEVGRGKITDVQEAQARLDAVSTREISAESALTLCQARYRELTGEAAVGLAAVRNGLVPAQPFPDDLAVWQARGQEQNARVLFKRAELAIADAETAKYRLSGRPTLDLVASYTYKGQNGGLSPLAFPDSSRTSAIGVQLNLPLYAGGALDSRQRESAAKKAQAEQDLKAAQRDTRLQVQDAFLSVKTGVSRIRALEQSTLSASTALEATTLGRDLGTRTEIDVLDAQQRLFTAQLDLVQARTDYLLGRVRLASAAGELREDDLRSLNANLVH